LVPNGNIQTVTTRDVRGVIKLYDWVCHVWPNSTTGRIICDHASSHCSSEFGHCVDSPVKEVTAILALGAIKGDGGRPFERLSTLGMCCHCVCLVWEPSNSLVLARVGSDCEWVILVRLHWVALGVWVASRWCLLLLEVATF
jgi:hypothetical protein